MATAWTASFKQLWRSKCQSVDTVRHSATGGRQDHSNTEVDNVKVFRPWVVEDIARLDVSMNDIVVMEKTKAIHQLLEQGVLRVMLKSVFTPQVRKQIRGLEGHDVPRQPTICHMAVENWQNRWVWDALQDFNLVVQWSQGRLNFGSKPSLSVNMLNDIHCPKRPLTFCRSNYSETAPQHVFARFVLPLDRPMQALAHYQSCKYF